MPWGYSFRLYIVRYSRGRTTSIRSGEFASVFYPDFGENQPKVELSLWPADKNRTPNRSEWFMHTEKQIRADLELLISQAPLQL